MEPDDKTHSVRVPAYPPLDGPRASGVGAESAVAAKNFEVPPGTSALANNAYSMEAGVNAAEKFFDVDPMIEPDESLRVPGGGGKDSLSEEEAVLS